jgi:hypothetical protein
MRRRKGIKTPASNKGKVFREWREKQEEQKAAERRKARFEEGRLTKESSNASATSSCPSTPSLKDKRLEELQEIEDKQTRPRNDQSVDIDEIMAGGGFDGGADNVRKRSRPEERSDSSSRGASPALNVLRGPRKKDRLSNGESSTCSPGEKLSVEESSAYTTRYDDESPGKEKEATDTEMLDTVQTDNCEVGGQPHNTGERASPEGCLLYNNGDYCHRLETSSGCPYFHDAEARRAALETQNNRHSSVGQTINPDELNLDGTDTEVSEYMGIEVARPAKQYSAFVQMLMQKRPEMNDIVNVVKRRPRAVDMWQVGDQKRKEHMDE